MNGRRSPRRRFARTGGPCLPAALALACLLAAGCEDFDPFSSPPAEPEEPEPSERPAPPSGTSDQPAAEPAKPREPPSPHYPMGLRLRDLHNGVFSPDHTAMFPEDERNTVVHDFESGQVLRLTAEGEACAWSPDGQWLLYWNRGWCVVSRNGKTNRRVTAYEGKADDPPRWAGNLPVWHPAGPSLLLLDEKGRFRQVAVTGQRDRQVATTDQIPVRHRMAAPDFFVGPGGEWLFYVNRSRVGFLRSDGTQHRAGEETIRHCTAPRWSADGTAVLVPAKAPNSRGRLVRQMWRIDLATGQVQPVCRADPIRRTSGRYHCTFSPGGFRLAYVAEDRDQPRMVLVDARTRHLTKIHDEREAESLRFSPDGKRLAYVSDEQEGVVILDLEAPGGMRLRFPALFDRGNPTLDGWAADGDALLLWTATYTHWQMDFANATARRLWPDPWFGTADRTEFQTARVPLEEENLVPPKGSFEPVPPATADLEPRLEELPVQVVREALPGP